MSAESHPKEVIDFPLEKVRRRPHPGNRFHHRAAPIQAHLKSNAFPVGNRKQVIDNLEARFGRIPVNTSYVRQKIERTFLLILEQREAIPDVPAFDVNREFVPVEYCPLHRGLIPGEQPRKGWMVLQLLNISNGGSYRHLPPTPLSCGVAPVQYSLFPDIKEPHQDDADVHQHLPKTEHLQFSQDYRPRIKEHGFHVEQNKKHSDQVKLDRKPLPGIPDRAHPALVRRHLGARWFPVPDNPGETYDRTRQQPCRQEMDE